MNRISKEGVVVMVEKLDFKEIGLRIKERRKACGLTQEALSEQVGVNSSHISNIECAREKPSLTILIHISNALECSIDSLIRPLYTFDETKVVLDSFDKRIIEKLQYCDVDKKERILKIIDLI